MAKTPPGLLIPEFDAERHRYFTGPHERPGVNRLLRQSGFVDESYFYEEVTRRGKYVHTATVLYDRNDLDGVVRRKSIEAIAADITANVDPGYAGSVASYARWVDAVKPEWLPAGIEQPLVHPAFGYAGTPDRWGLIRAEYWNVEIKRGVPIAWHELQVAGYIPLRPHPKQRGRWRRGILYLHRDGKIARLVEVDRKPYNPIDADRMFRNCLDNFFWRLTHGDRTCFADRIEGAPGADYGIRNIEDTEP